jgi:predicted negative regulator of RcsB-dependent stress response
MPQHAKRVKIRRKTLRQPDEFETLAARTLAWADDNRQIVYGVVGAVLVVVLLGFVYGRYRSGQVEHAAVAFQQAHDTFQAGSKFAEAAQSFASVASDYRGTPFGRLALLYRAHSLARQPDAAAAATAYTEFLATSPDPAYLRQQALVGLAHAKEATGDNAGALDAYTQAGALEGAFRTDALLGAARLQQATGHPDAARDIYSRLLQENPDPELRTFLLSKAPGAAPAATAQAPAQP